MQIIEGKNYFTLSEIAEKLNCSYLMVQRYVYKGRLEAIKIKGRVYVTEDSYKALLTPTPYQTDPKRKPRTKKWIKIILV